MSVHQAKLFNYLLAAMMLPCCMVQGKINEPHQQEFGHRLSELHARMDAVSDALKGVEGFPKKAGLIDLQVARFFAEYQDGFFRVDGEPAFFGGFNMLLSMGVTNARQFPGWAGKDREHINSFLPKMRQIGVGILGSGTGIPALVQKDGSVNRAAIGTLAETIRQYGEMASCPKTEIVDVMLHRGSMCKAVRQAARGVASPLLRRIRTQARWFCSLQRSLTFG